MAAVPTYRKAGEPAAAKYKMKVAAAPMRNSTFSTYLILYIVSTLFGV